MADQKTEKPTQQRLTKARREGKFATSRDLISVTQFAIAVTLLITYGSRLFATLESTFVHLVDRAFARAELTSNDLVQTFRFDMAPVFVITFAALFGVAVVVMAIHLIMTGFSVSLTPLMPDIERLNFLNKVTQLPSQNIFTLAKAAIILPLTAILLYSEISGRLPELANLAVVGLAAGVGQSRQMLQTLLVRLTSVLVVLALVDLVRQKRKFTKSMMMSKQDIKDEAKESEGNQHTKGRIRRLQRDAARRSMIKAVSKATAVVVNPTHYAIALQYEMDSKSVPLVLAKGQDFLALQIKERARLHNIPVIENKPLAQALYKAVEVGQEIPPHLYRAVAEVLAYIYKTFNRR